MTDELRAAAQAGDRFANIILLAYKLGSWGVLSLALLVALRYVWDERALTNQALISELREGRLCPTHPIPFPRSSRNSHHYYNHDH